MREILFRGKDAESGEWVYGYYVHFETTHNVVYAIYTDCPDDYSEGLVAHCYDVNPETVGQYTGMTDKNGTKIFEGDIVKHIQKYEISGEVKSIAVIKWNEAYSCWSVEYTNGRITAFLGTEYHKLEVIGNVHDNPELLNK